MQIWRRNVAKRSLLRINTVIIRKELQHQKTLLECRKAWKKVRRSRRLSVQQNGATEHTPPWQSCLECERYWGRRQPVKSSGHFEGLNSVSVTFAYGAN
ncbi:hypothetical protein NPIL_185251 [Nephila pilipes]|uniref:Uncharacterized protein n=1 Tax=Nephila pilipes TaxID=299642 RepID=A0A8X6UGB9_NEPPI|nr:hypothetical protein NPIL_185251 [Nephila pilipes]